MSMKKAYEQKLQAQLDGFGAEISKLQAKADQAGADARIEYHQQIEELHAMQQEAADQLSQLKASGDDAWEDLKARLDRAWTSLASSVKSATARFG